jgi:hypothetical protein
VDRWTSRLKHLCHLIVRDRRPYCPVNGLMALVPLSATDSDDDASQTGTLFQMDVTAARSVIQIHCPLIAMLCDLETAKGFREFLDRFPSEQRQRRLGQRFPLVPDVEPGQLPAKVEGSVSWICESLFPNWVYRLFRLEESADGADMGTVTRGNVRLYQLMGEMNERRRRLARVLVRGVVGEDGGPPLFGGCYIAGTGKDAEHEQAFVPGVFRRLIEGQNFVSWTDKALGDEANYNRWTASGYTGLAICTVVVVGLGLFFWIKG